MIHTTDKDCDNYMGLRNLVKVRKEFICHGCKITFGKGTQAVSWTMVDGTDFFERKFCVECNKLWGSNNDYSN